MPISQGIFGEGSSFTDRFIPNFDQLGRLSDHCKGLGLKVVLTSGSFDMVHEGHALYLEKARTFGDILFVGVDSDAKIKKRKGPDRPIVPEDERLRILAHFRHVDVVTLKAPEEERWLLIKSIRPDVLVATQDTYTDAQIEELGALCGSVEVLEPMATTTTSARLRLVHLNLAKRLGEKLSSRMPEILDELMEEL